MDEPDHIPNPDWLLHKVEGAIAAVERGWQHDPRGLSQRRAVVAIQTIAQQVGIERLQAALSEIASLANGLPPQRKALALGAVFRAGRVLDDLNHYIAPGPYSGETDEG